MQFLLSSIRREREAVTPPLWPWPRAFCDTKAGFRCQHGILVFWQQRTRASENASAGRALVNTRLASG